MKNGTSDHLADDRFIDDPMTDDSMTDDRFVDDPMNKMADGPMKHDPMT